MPTKDEKIKKLQKKVADLKQKIDQGTATEAEIDEHTAAEDALADLTDPADQDEDDPDQASNG